MTLCKISKLFQRRYSEFARTAATTTIENPLERRGRRRRRKPRGPKSSVAGGLGRSINRRTINAVLFSNEILFGGSSTVASPSFAFLRSMCAEDGTPCGTGSHVWDQFQHSHRKKRDSNEREKKRGKSNGATKSTSSNKNASVQRYLRNVNTS